MSYIGNGGGTSIQRAGQVGGIFDTVSDVFSQANIDKVSSGYDRLTPLINKIRGDRDDGTKAANAAAAAAAKQARRAEKKIIKAKIAEDADTKKKTAIAIGVVALIGAAVLIANRRKR